MTFPQYASRTEIRNTRFDEQGGKCYYCGCAMLREMQHRQGGGQPWYLCTLEHLTDRLDPRRWDKNEDDSPQRYAAACARCNQARSAWSQKHAPKELIDLLSRNIRRQSGREIVTAFYQHREYVPPPPFVPPEIKTCNPPCPEHICRVMAATGMCDYIPSKVKRDSEEFDEKVGTDVPPPKELPEFVLYRSHTTEYGGTYKITIFNKKDLPADAIYIGKSMHAYLTGEYCDQAYFDKLIKISKEALLYY